MLGKSCFFVISLFFLEGCTQPTIGWNHISCDESSNSILPYTLESLDRKYECKNQKGYK